MFIIGIYSPVPQSGKSTFANILQEQFGYAAERISFAEPVKATLFELLEMSGVDDSYEYLWGDSKGDVIPELGVTGGYLMSTFATSWARQMINDDLWLNIAKHSVRMSESPVIYFDDMRFRNEYDWIASQSHLFVKIIRNGAKNDRTKESEGNLDDCQFDYVIYNDGTLDEYIHNCARCTKMIWSEYNRARNQIEWVKCQLPPA